MSKYVLEEIEDRSRGLDGPARLGAAALRNDHPDRDLVPAGRARGHDVERSDCRARSGSSEAASSARTPPSSCRRLRRVSEGPACSRRRVAPRDVQRELPRDLESRLVEAGERPSRRDRLELAEDVPVVSLPLPEEAVGVLEVDAASIGERHGIFSRRKISLKVKTNEVLSRRRRFRRDRVFRSVRRGG